MKRAVLCLVVFGMFLICSTISFGETVSTTLDVSATILAVCTVSTTPINFVDYDPLSPNPNYAEGSVDVTCSLNHPYNIALDMGLHPDGSGLYRGLWDGQTSIRYLIYQDSNHSDFWGPDSFDLLSSTGTGVLQSHIAYGAIPAGESPASNNLHTDVVNVTVYY